jgi:hypothetical protein
MATINGKTADTTLYPTVTKGFSYQEVSVPSKYELELLGSKVGRKTVRYNKGQRVACKTWRDFENLRDKAQTYGGEVQFI